jgi:hypothetical protein
MHPLLVSKRFNFIPNQKLLFLILSAVLLALMTCTGIPSKKGLQGNNGAGNGCNLLEMMMSLKRRHVPSSAYSCLVGMYSFFAIDRRVSVSIPTRASKLHSRIKASSMVLVLLATAVVPLVNSHSIQIAEPYPSTNNDNVMLRHHQIDIESASCSDCQTEPPVIGSSPFRIYISFHQGSSDFNEIQDRLQDCTSDDSNTRNDDNPFRYKELETEYEVHVLEMPRMSNLSSSRFAHGRAPKHAYPPFASSQTIWKRSNHEEFKGDLDPIRHIVNLPKRQCVNTRGIPIAHSICHQRYYIKIWKIDWDIREDGSKTLLSRRLLGYTSDVKKYLDNSPVSIHFKLPVEGMGRSADEKCAESRKLHHHTGRQIIQENNRATARDEMVRPMIHEQSESNIENNANYTSPRVGVPFNFESGPVPREVHDVGVVRAVGLEHDSKSLQDQGGKSDTLEWILLFILVAMTVAFFASVRYVSNGCDHFNCRLYFYILLGSGREEDCMVSPTRPRFEQGDRIEGIDHEGVCDGHETNSRIVSPGLKKSPVAHARAGIFNEDVREVAVNDMTNSDLADSAMQGSIAFDESAVDNAFAGQGSCIDSRQNSEVVQYNVTKESRSIESSDSNDPVHSDQGGSTDSQRIAKVIGNIHEQGVESNVEVVESPPDIDRKGTCSQFCLITIHDDSLLGHDVTMSLDNEFGMITNGPATARIDTILSRHRVDGSISSLKATAHLDVSAPITHKIKTPLANDPKYMQSSLPEQSGSDSHLNAPDLSSSAINNAIARAPDRPNAGAPCQAATSVSQAQNYDSDMDPFSSSRSLHLPDSLDSSQTNSDERDANIRSSTQIIVKPLCKIDIELKYSSIRETQDASSSTSRIYQTMPKIQCDHSPKTFDSSLDSKVSSLQQQSTINSSTRGNTSVEHDLLTFAQMECSSNDFDNNEEIVEPFSRTPPSNNSLSYTTKSPEKNESFSRRSSSSTSAIDSQASKEKESTETEVVKPYVAGFVNPIKVVGGPSSNSIKEHDLSNASPSRKRKHAALEGLEQPHTSAPMNSESTSKKIALSDVGEDNSPNGRVCIETKGNSIAGDANDLSTSIENHNKGEVAFHRSFDKVETVDGQYCTSVSCGNKEILVDDLHPKPLHLDVTSSGHVHTNTKAGETKGLSPGCEDFDDNLLPSDSVKENDVKGKDEAILPNHRKRTSTDVDSEVNTCSTSVADTRKRSTTSLVFDFEVVSTDAIRCSPISGNSNRNIRELHQDTPESGCQKENSSNMTYASNVFKRPVIPRVPDPVPSKGLMSLSQEFQDPVWEFSESALSTVRVAERKRKLRDVSNQLDYESSKKRKPKFQQSISKRSSGSNRLRNNRRRRKRSRTVNIPSEIVVEPSKDAGSAITAPIFHCREKRDKIGQQGAQSSQSSGNGTNEASTFSSKSSRVY